MVRLPAVFTARAWEGRLTRTSIDDHGLALRRGANPQVNVVSPVALKERRHMLPAVSIGIIIPFQQYPLSSPPLLQTVLRHEWKGDWSDRSRTVIGVQSQWKVVLC